MASKQIAKRPAKKIAFPSISSRAFEHPADRAALVALRKVPGFDLVLRKLIGFVGERSLRYLFLASAVRVTERQYASVHALYVECCDILDIKERPELFITQTPMVNAGAIGVDKPFIVLNSGTVALLSDEELQFVIGHELGHILADHALYKTMVMVMMRLSFVFLSLPIGGLALLGVMSALLEWHRKSELSCDRAGLLTIQDPENAFQVFLKLAGAGDTSELSVEEFIRQAEEYEAGGSKLDSVAKLINLFGQTHPFHVHRLGALRNWVESGEYQRILDGDYARREDDDTTTIYEEFKAGSQSYKETYENSVDPLVSFVREVGQDVQAAGSSLWSKLKDMASERPAGKDTGNDENPPS